MDPEAEADGPAQATFLLLVAILVVGELGWKFSLEGRLEDLFRAHGGKAEVAQDLFHGAERVPEAVRGQLDQARQRSEAEEKGKGKNSKEDEEKKIGTISDESGEQDDNTDSSSSSSSSD